MKRLGSKITTTYPSNLSVRSLPFRGRLFTSSERFKGSSGKDQDRTVRGVVVMQIAEWRRVSKEAMILAETKKLIFNRFWKHNRY